MKKNDSILLSPQHGVNPMVTVCFWCGESIGIALLGKLPDDKQAPREGVLDYEPCDACKARMATGITFLEVNDTDHKYTGRHIIVSEEGFIAQSNDAELTAAILKSRKCLCLHSDFIQIFKEVLDGSTN